MYDNIKYIFLESNSGSAGKPRNIGIKNASSKYIMFLDNDDEYVPEACEILYRMLFTIVSGDTLPKAKRLPPFFSLAIMFFIVSFVNMAARFAFCGLSFFISIRS